MKKLKLFQNKFETISCLKKLGYKHTNTIFGITNKKNKFCEIYFLNNSRKINFILYEESQFIQIWIEKDKELINIREWLIYKEERKSECLQIDTSLELEKSFDKQKKCICEIFNHPDMENILKGNDWWEEPLFSFYDYMDRDELLKKKK